MTVDDRLHGARTALHRATIDAAPDLGDLVRRRRRRRARHIATIGVAAALVVTATGVLYASIRDDPATSVAAGSAAPAAQPAAPVADNDDRSTFVLAEPPPGWQTVDRIPVGVDHSPAFAGEEFSQVYVRFDTDQGQSDSHDGTVDGTIRVAVGTYDDRIRDVFAGPSTRMRISGRDFDLVEVDTPPMRQTALVPVDLSERTVLIVGRGVTAESLIAVAGPIDPTQPIPQIGPAPDGFMVIHSGRAEFPSLTGGTAITYRDTASGASVTITTYDGVAISCFAHAWPYETTELTPIASDTGVLAQLDGPPGGIGTYRALWNHDHDTLIGIESVGIDRTQLLELADDLINLPTSTGDPDAHLQLTL